MEVARSDLEIKFPNLVLPASTPHHLLQPVEAFQPNTQWREALLQMGISSRAATKALFWSGNKSLEVSNRGQNLNS